MEYFEEKVDIRKALYFRRKPGNPYYIMAPDYRETSSGIWVLHNLCHVLNLIGEDAYLLGSPVVNEDLKTPILSEKRLNLHRERKKFPIVIYPEVVEGNPLDSPVVARYFLNKDGVLSGKKVKIQTDDLLFHFTSAAMAGHARSDGVLTFPINDLDLFYPPSDGRDREKCYLYQNRYPIDKIDYKKVPEGTILLSTSSPYSLVDLAEVFRGAKALYSYEWSMTCMAAILCGCPVVFIPGYGVSSENIEKLPIHGYGAAMIDEENHLEKARSTIGRMREECLAIEEDFWYQLDGFISITQDRAASLPVIDEEKWSVFWDKATSLCKNGSGTKDLKRQDSWGFPSWLAERAPSDARTLAIKTLLKHHPDVGTLGAAVTVGRESTAQDVIRTLNSLGEQSRPIDAVWLIGAPVPDGVVDEGIEVLQGVDPWPKVLSDRIAAGSTPDFLWIVQAGDELLPSASLVLGEHRLRNLNALIWYVDEAVLTAGGPINPMLKPDFNVDLLRSYPYVGRSLVVSTAAVQAAGGLDPQLGDLAPIDFLWRLVEQVGPPVVAHVPEVLQCGKTSLMDWVSNPETTTWFPVVTRAHFDRMGLEAQIQPGVCLGLHRIEYPLNAQPLISIIIPTRDQLPVLRACIEGLMERTTYSHYELLLVDNGSIDPSAVAFLDGLEAMETEQIRVLHWPQAFDFAAINNFAVAEARGDILLFLNNDIQFASRTRSDWLERLLRHALRPEVGMVGSRLDLPDGGVDQCGQVLGLDNSVGAAFRGLPEGRQGYMNRLIVQQNVSALSASCLMMRRQVFDELGGFDAESFPVYYADADLCMKATQAGYLLVLEPDTGLVHMGGASRVFTEKFGLKASPDDQQRDRLYRRWLPQLARDPNYHPAFGRHSPGFTLSSEASRIQEPLPGRPLPVVLAAHGDWYGCGYYRVLHPFDAMSRELRLEGGLKLGDFHFTDVARIQPDVIVLQGAWRNEGILTQIRRYREITGAKVVLEFDDYLPNIPTRSIHRKQLSQGVIKNIRRAIEQVDWLVVSTPTLAQEYADFHNDIRVALNGLPLLPWGELKGQRRTKKKIRIGWAGGSSHAGDLAEIRSVVKDLQDEVEWVFMGMKPDGVVCEFHRGFPFNQYPKQLAALNLDLAVVPLEVNQFNRCKSNLRLLELGACGVPVICTDIDPFQCGLPVTRVRNRTQDWVRTIREHLADPDALAQEGDALRDAIRRNWMLEGDFLNQWARAWGVAPAVT